MIVFLIIIITFVLLIYWTSVKNYGYWKKRGIPYEKPIPVFGTEKPLLLNEKGMATHFTEIYWRHPEERVVGMFRGSAPYLMIRDPELAKYVFTNNFYSFHRRGIVPFKDDKEPMFQNLFSVDGDKWRLLRQRLTPLFSSAKLKAMFPLIVQSAEKLYNLAISAAKSGDEVDIRELMARYTTDFIGICVFGIDMNTLDNDDSSFRKLGKRIFEIRIRDKLVGGIKILFPSLGGQLKFIASDISEGIKHIMKSVMKQRNYKPSGRNDFIDILLEMKEQGTIIGESLDEKNPDGSPKIVSLDIDDNLMAAQVYVFFAAGFETSSSASGFALHLLAFYPEKQKKAHEEVDHVLKKYENRLCFDAVKEMQYLECVLKESLRILAPVGMLHRKCVSTFTFPGTNITVEKDVGIIIPVHGFHTDPKYFDEPKEFRPERFLPQNVDNIKKGTFLPFGEGYRGCIGARLGAMQALTGVAAILRDFELKPGASSKLHPVIGPGFTQNIPGGLPVILKQRKSSAYPPLR